MSTQQEKRLYPRAEVRWTVLLRTASGEINGETVNINAGGALVCCEESTRSNEVINEVIEVLIDVPSLVQPLALTAQVVRASTSYQRDRTAPCEIGLRFIEISDKHRWLISAAVQRESGAMLMP